MEVGALIVVIPLSAFMLYIAFKKDKKKKGDIALETDRKLKGA
ncbi:hypothetical protein STRIC_1440 [Streptococcus ictaluri 707-05]|uniref:Uncharacterized protein n=2 Tax=Streptococcus ictaluri TaxID=380397 RepID=G5K3R9_9STRE|nr:hypothetical protein STRIC_1440 [Streptococcus ictaluri 707-05]